MERHRQVAIAGITAPAEQQAVRIGRAKTCGEEVAERGADGRRGVVGGDFEQQTPQARRIGFRDGQVKAGERCGALPGDHLGLPGGNLPRSTQFAQACDLARQARWVAPGLQRCPECEAFGGRQLRGERAHRRAGRIGEVLALVVEGGWVLEFGDLDAARLLVGDGEVADPTAALVRCDRFAEWWHLAREQVLEGAIDARLLFAVEEHTQASLCVGRPQANDHARAFHLGKHRGLAVSAKKMPVVFTATGRVRGGELSAGDIRGQQRQAVEVDEALQAVGGHWRLRGGCRGEE